MHLQQFMGSLSIISLIITIKSAYMKEQYYKLAALNIIDQAIFIYRFSEDHIKNTNNKNETQQVSTKSLWPQLAASYYYDQQVKSKNITLLIASSGQLATLTQIQINSHYNNTSKNNTQEI